jgi:ATP-dependent helicase HrpA
VNPRAAGAQAASAPAQEAGEAVTDSPLRRVRDPYLPPDHDAFVRSGGERGRIIVIAPTRAACETIELGFGLDIETLLWQTRGAELQALAERLAVSERAAAQGFGIVAGTGTGKTLAVKPIAKAMLGTDELRVGVVNREREATPETPTWNVVIVTTGIARRWFQDGDIRRTTRWWWTRSTRRRPSSSSASRSASARGAASSGCRPRSIPAFYARYLQSCRRGDRVERFDPAKAAEGGGGARKPADFLDDKFLQR